MNFRHIVVCLVVFGLLFSCPVLAEDSNPEQAAVEAAEAWLKLVDDGQYAGSWEQAADYFRAMVNQQAWEDSVRPLRDSLGKVLARELTSKQSTTTLPGAPDGNYVIIQYETSFENKESAIETVTPMIDESGQWRVAGYYIK